MDIARAALTPLIEPRGWRELTHNLLGLPLGTAYFCWLVTGLALGAGLAVTLLGIPLLTLVLASVRPLMALERTLADTLLDSRLPILPLAPPTRRAGMFGRLAAYWTDAVTWRGVVYLPARFAVGLVTFTVAVTAYAAALYGIAAPVVAAFTPIDLGFWRLDSFVDGLALVPLGMLALIAAGWISAGMASVSRAFVRWVVRWGGPRLPPDDDLGLGGLRRRPPRQVVEVDSRLVGPLQAGEQRRVRGGARRAQRD